MASPIAWVHHFNVLLPAYVVALRVALALEGVQKLVILGLLGASFCLTAVAIMPPFDPTVPAFKLSSIARLCWSIFTGRNNA